MHPHVIGAHLQNRPSHVSTAPSPPPPPLCCVLWCSLKCVGSRLCTGKTIVVPVTDLLPRVHVRRVRAL